MKVYQPDKCLKTIGRTTDATIIETSLLVLPFIADTFFGHAGRYIGARSRTGLVEGVLTIILVGDRALRVWRVQLCRRTDLAMATLLPVRETC